MAEKEKEAVEDWNWLENSASVVETTTPWIYWIVVVKPDGSNV